MSARTTTKWQIQEILYWYDQPLIFTVVTQNNNLMLAYKYSETDPNPYWLGSVTAEQIQQLKDKSLTLMDVVDRHGYLFDGQSEEIDLSQTKRIPQDCLPEQGTYLYLTS